MHYAQKDNGIYILSRNDMEDIATEKLKEFSPINLERPMPLKTTQFLEDYLGLITKNKYICDFDSGILGLTVMGDFALIPTYDECFEREVIEATFGTVLITPQLSMKDQLPRRRYTEMHEASHFMLHQPYFKKREATVAPRTEYPCPIIACRKIESNFNQNKTDGDWIEYQADALSAALLMPKNVFTEYVKSLMRKYDIRGICMLEDSYTDRAKIYSIIDDAAEIFLVSHQAVKIRMKHLGLLRKSNTQCCSLFSIR